MAEEMLHELIGRLEAIPPYEDPLRAFWQQVGESPLTYRLLYAQRQLLDDCEHRREEEARGRYQVVQRCETIQPISLPHLTWGF
jgi:hypothetical protein